MKQLTRDSLIRYRDDRIPTGSFLRAVLENNFMEAFKYADHENQRDMHEIAKFIYNDMPMSCHGSPEIVDRWLANKSE